MISITTPAYDLQGQVLINEDNDSIIRSNARRVSRTATLDGGCAITDQGFSHADRTLDIRQEYIDQAIADILWYMFRTYSLVHVSTEDGVFLCNIQDVKFENGLQAKILIKEKLS